MPCVPLPTPRRPASIRGLAAANIRNPGRRDGGTNNPGRSRRRPNNAFFCNANLSEVLTEPSGPVTFQSRTGNGSLLGFTPYQASGDTTLDLADPAAPWNSGPFRKYRRRTLSGTRTREFFDDLGRVICYIPGSFPYPAVGSYTTTFSGSAYVRDDGLIDQATESARSYDNPPSPGACIISAPTLSGTTQAIGNGFSDSVRIATPTRLERFGLGTVPRSSDLQQYAYFVESGASVEELSEPDTEWQALARAFAFITPGAETTPPVYEPSAAGSSVPINFTGATAVRASAPFVNIPRASAYFLRATLLARPLTSGAAVEFVDSQPIAAPSGLSATLSYDLPILPGSRTSLLSLVLVTV